MMSPLCTRSPTFTSGRWLMQVDWFERWYFMQPVDIDARLGGVEILGGADNDTGGVDLIDRRRCGAPRSRRRESRAVRTFHPGANQWRLRREATARPDAACCKPISARFASSCSRNGISAPARSPGLLRRNVDRGRPRRGATSRHIARPGGTDTRSSVKRPSAVERRVGLRDDDSGSSSIADEVARTSSVHRGRP